MRLNSSIKEVKGIGDKTAGLFLKINIETIRDLISYFPRTYVPVSYTHLGMGGKITPSAVLVIQNGTTKLVNIKNQDGLTKVLDMVPDFVNKFTSKGEKENVVEESEDDSVAKKTAAKEMEQILSDSVNKEE